LVDWIVGLQSQQTFSVLRFPQMLTGYPGIMLLDLFPPLWFKVMNKQLAIIKQQQKEN